MHRDYLGSILAITDALGHVMEERHIGAWGSVDKFLDNNGETTFGHGSLLGRGFTGHEHFFEVSLIHMNGRMYDPQLGRFLSPDNFIQDPFNTQNHNRYGYALNNPLLYTDPSGEAFAEVIVIVAMIVGAAITVGNLVFGNHTSNVYNAPDNFKHVVPTPTNNLGSAPIASSMSGGSKTNPEWDFGLPTWKNISDFGRGLGSGIIDGGRSFWDFVKSLGTVRAWKEMGQGFVDIAEMGSFLPSGRGIMLRSELVTTIEGAIEELPNMSAYQWGYGVGYGAVKVTEGLMLSKGASVATNVARSSGGLKMLSGLGSSAAKTGTSLGAGRTGVKQWLQNAGNLERGTLFKT